MPRITKPSSLSKFKDSKLTRRKLLQAASAAGFGTATISTITVDDVKAADSDEVTISITCDGSRKVRVSSDWYDYLERTRRVKKKMENNWLSSGSNNGQKDKHNDVMAVWLNAGTGSQNPHLILTIDEDSDTKDETRGDIPEWKNNVRIAVEEAEREYKPACDPQCKSNLDTMPGGLSVSIQGTGTLGPQAYDYNNNKYVLTTAAHVASKNNTFSEDECGDDLLGKTVDHCGDYIGYVDYIDHVHDVCIIEPTPNPLPEIWNPSDHSDRYGTITDSLSKDGVDYWMNNGRKAFKYGIKTCYTWGYVHARGKKENPGEFGPCTDTWEDCVRWGQYGDLGRGDSGSVAFGADPDSNDFFAICQNSWRWYDYTTGPAGYAWKNQHGYEWRTF